ncbi:MAG: hypothetical protein A2Z96_03120 [Spirochaetes bacterium GWB1_48_6]|nr:MAG: hypothetical protein A2Z96_03120 [Spirochaetes bacterium GWB1_48_6]OHE65708.1 MAG: hypothetical protein A2001_14930 [Treponema sp. GWC1_61_84]
MTRMIINREIALKNLTIARDILGAKGIPMFLHFGTLLGALREKDFIAHDDDTDVGVYGSDKKAIQALIPALKAAGFEIVYTRDERLYKFKRQGEDLDFFFAYEKKNLFGRRWDLEGRASIPARHLDTLDETEFLGERFKVPHDPYAVVRNLYGRTWNVPIAHFPSRVDWRQRLAKLRNNPGKFFFYIRRFLTDRSKKAASATKPSGI